METITLTCQNCGNSFIRNLSEYKRCVKRGFAISCSRSCGATLRNYKHSKGNINFIAGYTRQDEYSPFRYYLNKAKNRREYGDTDLDLLYLKKLWESQAGICPYTGYKMDLPKNTQDSNIKGSPEKASLDRIDSSLGYIRGNVQFVCLSVNLAKNGFSHEQMLSFFKKINLNE